MCDKWPAVKGLRSNWALRNHRRLIYCDQLYVFDHAKLIQIACNIARCTPTAKTILTTGTKTSSGCNLGSMHHKRLILVSNYMFMAIISLLKKLFLLSCVYKHQKQYNQQVPELSQGVNICHIS